MKKPGPIDQRIKHFKETLRDKVLFGTEIQYFHAYLYMPQDLRCLAAVILGIIILTEAEK
jgi:hypothetical protein